MVEIPVGQVIYEAGKPLTSAQLDLFQAELTHFASGAEPTARAAHLAGIAAASVAITLALTGYTILFCPRIRTKLSRMIGLATVLLTGLLVACGATAMAPQFGAITTITPTVFVAMLMCIAYDRRSALAYGLLHGLMVALLHVLHLLLSLALEKVQ